jgi:hypothetical protein
MCIIQDFFQRRAATKFLRSSLGQALHRQTQEYFYTTSNLRHLSDVKKQEIIGSFWERVFAIFQAPNPFLKMREELAGAVYEYAILQVLCLKETERADQFYDHSPYITGKLHYRIRECVPHNEDLKYALWQTPKMTDEEIVYSANLQCCQYLYFLNGFNLLRPEFNDVKDGNRRDWFRPFISSMLIFSENTYREHLGMPPMLPGGLIEALRHSTFMNIVSDGTEDPLYEWETRYKLSHPAAVAGAVQ